jgi:hypothetical protein
MKYTRLMRTPAIGAACAVVGTGAGIAGSSAATDGRPTFHLPREAILTGLCVSW